MSIYGNSKQEAMCPAYLDAVNRCTVPFAPGQLPPVKAFWSLTMYDLSASLLVANPINRLQRRVMQNPEGASRQ